MTTENDSSILHCSLETLKTGEDIVGSIDSIRLQISIELKEPWEGIASQSTTYPADLKSALSAFQNLRLRLGVNYFAPETNSSVPGFTRVFLFKSKAEYLAPFEKYEWLLANASLNASLLEIARSFNELSATTVEGHVASKFKNEIFVCGHDSRDACCGKWGIPVYRRLKALAENRNDSEYRVWKTSHIGGHKYAPTLFEAPSMRWWGLLSEDKCEDFLNREASNFSFEKHYRGWAALDTPFAQVAEREVLKKLGWSWLNAQHVTCHTGANDEFTQAHVKIQSSGSAEKRDFSFNADVEVTGTLSSIASCGASVEKTVKQYRVSNTRFSQDD